MRSWIARRVLRSANKRYGYDTSYLEMMLKESPSAFFKFARVAKAAGHREVVPADASFAVKLVGAGIGLPIPSFAVGAWELPGDTLANVSVGRPREFVSTPAAKTADPTKGSVTVTVMSCVTRPPCPSLTCAV